MKLRSIVVYTTPLTPLSMTLTQIGRSNIGLPHSTYGNGWGQGSCLAVLILGIVHVTCPCCLSTPMSFVYFKKSQFPRCIYSCYDPGHMSLCFMPLSNLGNGHVALFILGVHLHITVYMLITMGAFSEGTYVNLK